MSRRAITVVFGTAMLAGAMIISTSVGSADPSTPGGALSAVPASVVDNNSGTTYFFNLRANEDDFVAGKGSVAMDLSGPALSLCTSRSTGGLAIDFSAVPESGTFPYQNVQCGRAFGQTVSIDGCVATLKAHGFVHSDDPNSNVLDGMTITVRFQKTGALTANLDATIATVTKRVAVHGRATSAAPIFMPTCP